MRCKQIISLLAISIATFSLNTAVRADADTGADQNYSPGDIVPPPNVQEAAPPAPAPGAAPIAVPAEPAPAPVAGTDVSSSEPEAEYFYGQLAPYSGQWVNIPEFGPCWQPANLTPDWRPYTLGHWVYTDDNGWLWSSDEDFGWCTYHYGRWTQVAGTGWVWVPGRRWGPAWVVWRNGDRYVGWAPLPPGRHGRPIEQLIAEVNPYAYNFCDQRFILEDHIHEHLEPVTRNVTFVSITPNITHFDLVEGKYIDRGMPIADVEHWVGHPIDHFHVAESLDVHGIGIHGHDIAMFRPHPPERVVVHAGPEGHDHPFFAPVPQHVVVEDEKAHIARDDYYNKLDADMKARHEQEMHNPPPNVGHDDMIRRQDQERQFLDDQRRHDDGVAVPPQVLRHEDEHH
jgi:hypothetical protein